MRGRRRARLWSAKRRLFNVQSDVSSTVDTSIYNDVTYVITSRIVHFVLLRLLLSQFIPSRVGGSLQKPIAVTFDSP